MTKLAYLPERGLIEISGEDRVIFLQGLVSNDVTIVGPDRAVWAAQLTPQGKWLADFFIFTAGQRLLLDCERGQAAEIAQRLIRFRLRARIAVQNLSETHFVHVAWDGPPPSKTEPILTQAPDPRLTDAGFRILTTSPLPTTATAADWDTHRIVLGLPDGSRDLERDKTVLLEAGFDELSGVSWTKGCYLGQELTARTKHRGLVKRRLFPVAIAGSQPIPGAVILQGDREVGTMRSAHGQHGLALLRLDALGGAFLCGETRITPVIPDWMRLPSTENSTPRI